MSIQKDDPKKNKEKSIHAGHRKRMLERFYREGLDNFTDIQIPSSQVKDYSSIIRNEISQYNIR